MRSNAARERGFTLIEMIVTTVVLTVVMVGLYMLLDSSNKLAKQETHVAEAQQSVRIGVYEVSRIVRQGRVGGLYLASAILPHTNNAPGGTKIDDLTGTPHYIRRGTDVILVRGILSGDKYGFATGDVVCTPADCATATSATVTIRSTSGLGVSNYASGSTPAIASHNRPFYFVVATGENGQVSIGGADFLIPLYIVGLVDTTGTWYTQTSDTFTFTMNPQDPGAIELMPPTSPSVNKPIFGGVVDEVLFFVDEGPTDRTGSTVDPHPILAEAIRDAATGNYDVQPLVQEVEDFQIAYGLDGADGTVRDRGVSPATINTTGTGRDEWVGNVANEISSAMVKLSNPTRIDALADTSLPAIQGPPIAIATLRSVWVSLVVKSADPDFQYNGPGARGMATLDSTAVPISTATGRPYRRRVQSFAVSLRNYQ